MKSILSFADALTLGRILLILPISWALLQDYWFFAIVCYLLAVFTDFLDGRVARRTQTCSSYGAAFDGGADMVLGAAIVCWIWALYPSMRGLIFVYGPTVALLALLYFVFARIRTGRFLVLHLWTGKLTGLVLYSTFPLLLWLQESGSWLLHLLGLVTCAFYLEAIVYVARGRSDPNGRSAFGK